MEFVKLRKHFAKLEQGAADTPASKVTTSRWLCAIVWAEQMWLLLLEQLLQKASLEGIIAAARALQTLEVKGSRRCGVCRSVHVKGCDRCRCRCDIHPLVLVMLWRMRRGRKFFTAAKGKTSSMTRPKRRDCPESSGRPPLMTSSTASAERPTKYCCCTPMRVC